ncbi:MAG: hypothetical protein HZB99_04315 [Candidatus Harrisonbacteria bacterium]|nr:hypothetical protein [Candidatus Harrisonbacteria bacterium]
MKKYLKILAVLIIIAAVVWLIYSFFYKTPAVQKLVSGIFPSGKPVPERTVPEGQSAKPKFYSITQAPIFDYWINSQNNAVYYLNEFGQVIRFSDNSEELVNSRTLTKLNRVEASNDGSFGLAKFNFPNSPIFAIFDTTSTNWQPLPAGTISAAWSPNSPELLFADDKSLNIFNIIKQKFDKILDLSQKEVEIAWVSSTTALLSTPPTFELNSSLWLLNLTQKNLAPLIQDENGLTLRWFKNSDLGIKLFNKEGKVYLSLINKDGATQETFSFLTLPSKCLIDKLKIYCAVPKNINPEVRWPDDYYKKAVYFDDALYLIDLESRQTIKLEIGSEIIFDAEHLELHQDSLLFKNRLDGKLYGLRLE